MQHVVSTIPLSFTTLCFSIESFQEDETSTPLTWPRSFVLLFWRQDRNRRGITPAFLSDNQTKITWKPRSTTTSSSFKPSQSCFPQHSNQCVRHSSSHIQPFATLMTLDIASPTITSVALTAWGSRKHGPSAAPKSNFLEGLGVELAFRAGRNVKLRGCGLVSYRIAAMAEGKPSRDVNCSWGSTLVRQATDAINKLPVDANASGECCRPRAAHFTSAA